MPTRTWFLAAAAAAVVAGIGVYSQSRAGAPVTPAPGGSCFRILLGVGDRKGAAWDGTVTATPGKVAAIRGWRFENGDSTDSVSSWKAATRDALGRKGNRAGVVPNGIIVELAGDDASTRFDVKTAQGTFSFRAQEILYGEQKPFLNGRVLVDRVPAVAQITDSPEEQEYPAVAQSGDSVYVAYIEFTHSSRALEMRRNFTEAPKDFDFLARPAGGDQVCLMQYSKANRTWGKPIAVSAPKQDIMRASVAVDGKNRVWVFWSANQKGNFDIYARRYDGSRWSPEMRITTDAGTDVNPVAVTDAGGRVWITWQGFRKDNLEILAAAQNGDRFTPETVVSVSRASDWDPSIAAAPNGDVAISWDTYDKGDYDVYFRRVRFESGTVSTDAPVPVAASRNFEARSSIAYDRQNRLWVAYEASDTKWGKDFGAYETSGIALYQDHTIRVKCFQGAQALEPAGDLQRKLPGKEAGSVVWMRNRSTSDTATPLPNPALAVGGNASPHTPDYPLNSFPRIAADPNGTIYVAFRTPVPGHSPMGTVWMQNVTYFDGVHWRGPVPVPQTDHWLDSRAAMAAIAPGDLMIVGVSDHRQGEARPRRRAARQGDEDAMSVYNADLVAAELRMAGSVETPQLRAVAAETVAQPDPEAVAERAQIAMMRQYRANIGSQGFRLMRGEFHRHTEMSGDGGKDGPVIDAYRYLIDAASMDWSGCCDHDNGGGRESTWWYQQKLTDAYKLGSVYVPMFAYERSVKFPEGHRNAVFAQRGIRPLPRLPKMDDDSKPTPAPDTQMLYRYLRQFNGIVASHTSGTGMGTDWRDNDPILEPVVEIYQGDRQNYEMIGAPRSNTVPENHPGWVSLALKKGYRLGFQASSDHISTHMSYCNLWVKEPTREGIMEAFHKRRVYGATDNILADVRCGAHFMGEEFKTSEPPSFTVKLWGTAPFAKVHIIKDGQYAYTAQPKEKNVNFSWRDNAAQKGRTSFYYVRGEQVDGELVWVSPMWITYE